MMTIRTRRPLLALAVGVLTASAAMAGAPVAGQSDDAEPATGEAQPVPQAKGPIEPGRYRDGSTGPTVEFSLDDGWQVVDESVPQVGVDFGLADNESAEFNLIAYTGQLFTDPCWNADNQDTYSEIITYAKPTAEGLVTYLTTHPSIIATATETTLGGLPASQVDMEISVGEGCYDKLGLWHLPPFNYTTLDGSLGRAVTVDSDNGTFVALILGPPDVYPTLLEKAMATLDSLEFPLVEQ